VSKAGACILLAFLLTGLLLVLLNSCSRPALHDHTGEASWTLQGQTSLLDCPRQRPWYVEIDGTQFFMGCQ